MVFIKQWRKCRIDKDDLYSISCVFSLLAHCHCSLAVLMNIQLNSCASFAVLVLNANSNEHLNREKKKKKRITRTTTLVSKQFRSDYWIDSSLIPKCNSEQCKARECIQMLLQWFSIATRLVLYGRWTMI